MLIYSTVLKIKAEERMGLGFHYNPEMRHKAEFSDKESQVVLIYVTVEDKLVYTKLVMQPAGGWYPIIALHPYGKT